MTTDRKLALDEARWVPVGLAATESEIFLALTTYASPWDNCVAVLDHDGNILRRWGAHGDGRGEFCHFSGLAVRGQIVFVASEGRLQAFRPDGSVLWLRAIALDMACPVLATDDTVFLGTPLDGTIVALSHEGLFRFRFVLQQVVLYRLIGASSEELFVCIHWNLEPEIRVFDVKDGTLLRIHQVRSHSLYPLQVSPHGLLLCHDDVRHCLYYLDPEMRSRRDTWTTELRGWIRLAAFSQTQQFWLRTDGRDLFLHKAPISMDS